MPKNPYLNAVLASAYIVVAVFIISGLDGIDGPETILMPMAGISLFTLSAAVMGYLFLANPIMFYLDGKKKEAVTFFLRTTGTFGVITASLFLLAFSGMVR